MTRPSRGIRNNNPGNIRKVPVTAWEGRAPAAMQTDPEFLVFASAAYGVRAICVILRSYRQRSGCDTLRKMFDRWAPPVENNTAAYIADVVHEVGILADTRLPPALSPKIVVAVAKAITHHENGYNPYPDQVFLTGAKLAGFSEAPHALAA